jgi:hypothetical protein
VEWRKIVEMSEDQTRPRQIKKGEEYENEKKQSREKERIECKIRTGFAAVLKA